MSMYNTWGTADFILFKQAGVEYGNKTWHNLLTTVKTEFKYETFLMPFSYCFCFYQPLRAENITENGIPSEEFLTNVGSITEQSPA